MSASAISDPLAPELVQLIADRFKALADPTRIRLLDRLHAGEATVGELANAAGSTEQNVSKHMLTLLRAGLVARKREGNFVRYRIDDPWVYELCETVCRGVREELAALIGTVGR